MFLKQILKQFAWLYELFFESYHWKSHKLSIKGHQLTVTLFTNGITDFLPNSRFCLTIDKTFIWEAFIAAKRSIVRNQKTSKENSEEAAADCGFQSGLRIRKDPYEFFWSTLNGRDPLPSFQSMCGPGILSFLTLQESQQKSKSMDVSSLNSRYRKNLIMLIIKPLLYI